MKMKILIKNMKYNDMIKVTNECKSCEEEINFDFNELEFIEPAGAVVLLSYIEYLQELNKRVSFTPLSEPMNKAVSYGCNMGIFQQLGLIDSQVYQKGSTYIAPKKVHLDQIEVKEEEFFEEFSSDLTSRIMPNIESDDNKYRLFQYVIREIIRNVFDHSESETFCYGVQKYPKTNLIEVAISDLGVGLKETVPFDIEDMYLKKTSDRDAIHKAMEPGVSNYSNHTYAPEDYKNSGYGLTLIRKIVEKCDGKLSIATGESSLTFSNKTKEKHDECNVKGTIIRIKIDSQKLESIDFEEVLKSVETDGKKAPSAVSKSLNLSLLNK